MDHPATQDLVKTVPVADRASLRARISAAIPAGKAGRLLRLPALALLWALIPGPAPATPPGDPAGVIAILIDDLGNNWREAARTIALPGPVACAILPHTRYARRIATAAHRRNKEVLLHLPMESTLGKDPGPGKLDTGMPRLEIALTLSYDLDSVPHAVGVNNHMGSRLTQQAREMDFLMQALKPLRNLFFVDSLTSRHSVAARMARENGIPYLVRDVFLDSEASAHFTERQFDRLLRRARQRGKALALGHASPTTLAVLERRLPELAEQNIRLVPLSTMLEMEQEGKTWRQSSYP